LVKRLRQLVHSLVYSATWSWLLNKNVARGLPTLSVDFQFALIVLMGVQAAKLPAESDPSYIKRFEGVSKHIEPGRPTPPWTNRPS
jgi:hypothetical protein